MLHIDRNDYYGAECASLNLDQVRISTDKIDIDPTTEVVYVWVLELYIRDLSMQELPDLRSYPPLYLKVQKANSLPFSSIASSDKESPLLKPLVATVTTMWIWFPSS